MKGKIVEIDGSKFELVPCKAFTEFQTNDDGFGELKNGYLLKPVEDKPIKAEVIWFSQHKETFLGNDQWLLHYGEKPPLIDPAYYHIAKAVRPMKREDVHDTLFHDGILDDHTIQRGVILDRLEELGLIESEGE